MGIVVSIVLLLANVGLWKPTKFGQPIIGWLVGATGLWNVLWYGVRHLTEFWGQTALISGLALLLAAIIILHNSGVFVFKLPAWLIKCVQVILLLSFLLYAITIIQLNLGYPIIR